MNIMDELKELQRFVALSLQNADGLRYPYNLSKINKKLKEIINGTKETRDG